MKKSFKDKVPPFSADQLQYLLDTFKISSSLLTHDEMVYQLGQKSVIDHLMFVMQKQQEIRIIKEYSV